MKSVISNLYTGAVNLKKAVCFAVLLLYIVLTVYSGGNVLQLFMFGIVMVAYVWLPGRYWNMILGGNDRFYGIDFGIDILLGSGFFCAVYCVAMRLNTRLLVIAVPLVFSVLGVFLMIRRGHTGTPQKLTADSWRLALLFFGLLLLYTFTGVVKYALPSNVGDTLLAPDMLWNVGNANAFTIRFIPEEIRYSGVQLHYHYLTELFAGALAWLTGIPAYNIVAFYMQPYVLACVVYCLYSFGNVWFADRGKAMLFSYSMFVFNCGSMWNTFLDGRSDFYNDNAYHIITNINAQATATVFLCIFSAMFVQLMRKGFAADFIQVVLWLAAFFMLTFAKGPVAAIVAVGGAITLLWLFIRRKAGLKAPLCGAAMAGMFFVVYSLFFASGANTSMAFNIWGTLSKSVFAPLLEYIYYNQSRALWYVAHIVLMVVLVVAFAPLQGFLYLAGLPKDIKNIFSLSGSRLWANSMIVGGFMAYYLFNHYAMSQVYFAFLALFFMHLIAIDNLSALNGKWLQNITALMACAALVTSVFMYTNFIGSGARFLARNLGIIEKYPYLTVVTADDQLAMEFLHANSDKNALFATNRIHSSDVSQDGVSNIYSAFSGRQSYMEGYSYALTNMGVPYYVVSQRKEINQKLFSADTSPEELKYLCETTGITHLVYSAQFAGEETVIASLYEKIYHGPDVRIYATGATPLTNHPLYQPELAEYGEGIKD